MIGSERWPFIERSADGASTPIERPIAVEQPCALEVNGVGYAVMMVTPADLEDFAFGFCLSERLIDGPSDLVAVDRHDTDQGILLRITTAAKVRPRVFERVRHRATDSSCGLCGVENLEQALRPLPSVTRQTRLDAASIFKALDEMRAWQPLNGATGAVHAAMACSAGGTVLLAREDVGRHNAFDKLIGAMLRSDTPWSEGFALLSSRCSYELVEKAALAGCPTLVTVSAATTLALQRAAEAGVELFSLARPDSFLRLSR